MTGWLAATSVDPDVARAQAVEITDELRASDDGVPRPLRAPLEWLGHRLQPIGDLLSEVYAAVPWWVWLALAAGLLALLVWQGSRATRRRAAANEPRRSTRAADPSDDPGELEALAAAAEATGDHDRAVRLRFRAGLLRLERAEVIELDDSSTNGSVRSALTSRRFDTLAEVFEDVAYGDLPADADDSAAAREEWPAVVDEASAGTKR